MCGKHRKRPASDDDDEEASNGAVGSGDAGSQFSLMSSLRAPTRTGPLLGELGPVTPVVVYTGPTRKEPTTQLATAGKPVFGAAPVRGKGKAVAAASAGPWSAFSSSALAASPPADLVATEPLRIVPLPRPRPKIRATSAAR
jgi:D-alanyl-D-alanine carboxypeptidase